MLYFRYSQVAFSFSRYKKNFLDIIKIILFFILVIAIIFGIFLLIDGIITSFKKKKSRIIAGSVSFITEGLLISVISMMTMVGAFCFYPSGYKCEDMKIFFNASQVELKDDRNYFTGLYRDNGKDKITLFFPGNGMSAKHVMSAFNYYFENANTNILAVDYPYFGYSKGILSEKTLKKECDMFYEYITGTLGYEKENVIIAGFSIGTFMATYTASTHEASKLVLGAPYNNFTSVLNTYVNVFYPPISNTIEFKFKSDEYARNVKCPVTIVYTLDDNTVPCKLALKLSESFETDVKLIEMEYGGHNGVLMDVHYIEEVMDFIYEGRENIDG